MRLRRHFCQWTALCAALLILHAPSAARDAEGQYKAQGLGLDACSSFLGTPESKRALYYSWLAGYLTAYNYLVKDTYSIAEYFGLARTNEWLGNYCEDNPDHLLHQAARQFVTELYRVRLKRKLDRDDEARFQYYTPR